MATYFDSNKQEDLKLLREAHRDVSELAELASGAEADVLRYYTGRIFPWYAGRVMVGPPTSIGGDPERFIYLWGYKVDSAAASVDFKDALRRTIGQVLDWRIARAKKDPMLTVDYKKGVFRGDANAELPRGWSWRLKEYDVRPDSTTWAV